jgi:hypothetical protein
MRVAVRLGCNRRTHPPFAGNIIPKAQFGGQYQGFLNVIQPFYKTGLFGAPGSEGANGDFSAGNLMQDRAGWQAESYR